MAKAVGVTDYTNRVYDAQASAPIQLYVGYYASQRTGDTIHSVKACPAGGGSDPVRSVYATIPVSSGGQIVENDYVIAQDQNKQPVFYWYQGRGPIIASEYWGKFSMVPGATSRHRTDGALIRRHTPIRADQSEARSQLGKFTQLSLPASG